GAGYKVLDTPDAKTALNESPILLHLRDHRLNLFRVFNDRADRSLQRLDIVFDEEPPPPEYPQFAYQIAASVAQPHLRRVVFDGSIPVRQMMRRSVLLWRREVRATGPSDRRGDVHVFAVSEHPTSIDHTRPRIERGPNAGWT